MYNHTIVKIKRSFAEDELYSIKFYKAKSLDDFMLQYIANNKGINCYIMDKEIHSKNNTISDIRNNCTCIGVVFFYDDEYLYISLDDSKYYNMFKKDDDVRAIFDKNIYHNKITDMVFVVVTDIDNLEGKYEIKDN